MRPCNRPCFARESVSSSLEQDSYASKRLKSRAVRLIAGQSYTRTMAVTQEFAAGSRERTKLDKFERLYWSELVFLETEKVKRMMVHFRKALLRGGSTLNSPSEDLTQLAKDLRAACEAHLQLATENTPPTDDFYDARLLSPKRAYEQKSFDTAKQQFKDLFFRFLGSEEAARPTTPEPLPR